MQRDPQVITDLAKEYHLNIAGLSFWVPYWKNWDHPPYFLNAPFAGKGTPSQIKRSLVQLLQRQSKQPETVEGVIALMMQVGLGVDCSGLAYYILSSWLRLVYHIRLANHIFVPKDDVILASQRPHWQKVGVSPDQLAALPDQVSVAEVCRLFKRQPARITNVARLCSKTAADTVAKLSEVQPGDLIKMTGSEDHVGVITETSPGKIRYIESRGFLSGPGTVRFQDILIVKPDLGLEAQEWEDRSKFNPAVGDRICRLKVLNGCH